ncbi:hypothetical protein VNO77_08516 [Canavalia gladiata]|uniref:Uncharacterized protein n=1 Tax=Canavalia gladiata TaxID=3824 RepID=A0AAN9ME30_CANGL
MVAGDKGDDKERKRRHMLLQVIRVIVVDDNDDKDHGNTLQGLGMSSQIEKDLLPSEYHRRAYFPLVAIEGSFVF